MISEQIKQFLLEAQHHSGLPLYNSISNRYIKSLSHLTTSDSILDDTLINCYMIDVHEEYNKNKQWKSYDW